MSWLDDFQTTWRRSKITPKFRAVLLIWADRQAILVEQGFMPVFNVSETTFKSYEAVKI